MIANRAVALVYRLVAVVSAVAGLSLLLDLGTGRPDWGAFLYYTGMSNLLCLVWLTAGLVTAIRGLRREGTIGSATSHPRTGAAVMMAITVTMLIYLTMLEPPHSPNVLDWFQQYDATNLLVHIATPCLVVLDWFLFAPKGRLRWFDPLLWLLIPLGYLGFSWLWAAAGGRFGDERDRVPYPFLDVEANGIEALLITLGILLVALSVVGYLYLGLDRLLARVPSRHRS